MKMLILMVLFSLCFNPGVSQADILQKKGGDHFIRVNVSEHYNGFDKDGNEVTEPWVSFNWCSNDVKSDLTQCEQNIGNKVFRAKDLLSERAIQRWKAVGLGASGVLIIAAGGCVSGLLTFLGLGGTYAFNASLGLYSIPIAAAGTAGGAAAGAASKQVAKKHSSLDPTFRWEAGSLFTKRMVLDQETVYVDDINLAKEQINWVLSNLYPF